MSKMTKEDEILKNAIFIPGEVMSSKNSKQVAFHYLKPGQSSAFYYKTSSGMKPVRLMVTNSKQAKEYIKNSNILYAANRQKFLKLIEGKQPPYRVVFKFVRRTKHAFDYNNISQIVQDLMVDHNWIDDDNMNMLRPYYLPFGVDSKNPGVYIGVF